MQSLAPLRIIITVFFLTALSGCVSSRSSLNLPTPAKTFSPVNLINDAAPITDLQKNALIAVILPQRDNALSLATNAVQNGIEAARLQSGTANTVQTRYYYTTDHIASPILQYQRAIDDGAHIVIGPLTKTATDNLVRNITLTLPTFLLNTVSHPEKLSCNNYVMSLSIEEESREMAINIQEHGYKDVIIIYTQSHLSHRLGQAFADEWRNVANKLPRAVMVDSPHIDMTELTPLLTQQDKPAIFLAMTASEAVNIVPHLPPGLSLYGISQIAPEYDNSAQRQLLRGIHYADIPLFLPNNPWRAYSPPYSTSHDIERLYALGIDVYHQALYFLQNKQIPLIYEGAAGRWLKGEGQELKRQLSETIIGVSEVGTSP